MAPFAQRFHVLVGPGHNGWDGLWAAWTLRAQGRRVSLSITDGHQHEHGERAQLLDVFRRSEDVTPGIPDDVEVILDALFGLSLSRPLEGVALRLVQESQRRPALKLALDLPSGLDPATGQTFGAPIEHVFRAKACLALVCLKPGLLMEQGRETAGELWWCPAQEALLPSWPQSDLRLVSARDSLQQLPRREQASHKGRWGQVLVVGGASGMDGGARLAGEAALEAGAGKVWQLRTESTSTEQASTFRPECLVWHDPSRLPDWARSEQGVVVAGCGAGSRWQTLLSLCIDQAQRLVLDADALNLLAASPTLMEAVQGRAQRGLVTVLTPHPLEASRLLRCQTSEVQSDRIASARRLSQLYQCLVVLKGAGTLVTTPEGEVHLNATGGPNLAVGGSGDVLAGWLGGVWAQFSANSPALAQAKSAACYSVWLHGQASDEESHRRSLPGQDLIRAMSAIASAQL